MSQKFNVTFEFKEVYREIKGKKIRTAILLVDNAGYTCGIYNNYREAKAAMSKIRRNIIFSLKKRLENGQSIPVEFLNS